MNELVSIITPTFNRAYLIGRAIGSVLSQTYAHWEMIIIDDGSIDDTEHVVASYSDVRIHYERLDRNRGQSAARNRGQELARGTWITFLDSDNDFLPAFLQQATDAFLRHPEILCIVPRGHKNNELWNNGALARSIDVDAFPDESADIVKDIFMRRFIFDMNAFIHTATIRDEGFRFDETLPGMEDLDYALTIGEKHPREFFYLNTVLYNYHQRFGTDSLVSNTSYQGFAEEFERIYQKHKNDRMMEGQQWYPQRVEKWRKIQRDFEQGLAPPPHLYYFS